MRTTVRSFSSSSLRPSRTHRIVPMPAHRIASRDSPQRHRAAANNPVFGDRVARVRRATRLEAARRSVERMDYRRDRRAINRDRTGRRESWRQRPLQSICCICTRHQSRPAKAPLAAIRPLRLRAAMVSSLLIAGDASVAAPARAITTSDVPAGRLSRITRLKISRTRRFTRFRTTAIPIRRDTVTPSRERAGSSSGLAARLPA